MTASAKSRYRLKTQRKGNSHACLCIFRKTHNGGLGLLHKYHMLYNAYHLHYNGKFCTNGMNNF